MPEQTRFSPITANELAGRELYIASRCEYGICTDLTVDDHGFLSLYVVELDSGGCVTLHEDRLWMAGVLQRTVH